MIRLLGLLLFALALIPAIGERVCGRIEKAGHGSSNTVLVWLGIAGALVLLLILRSHNFLLGDTQTYMSALERGIRAAGGAHREPLPQAIVAGVNSVLGGSEGLTPHGVFTAVGLVLGAGFIACGLLLTRLLAKTTAARILLFSAVALGGTLQLYSGYAEFYGFVMVAVLLFVFLSIRSIEKRGSVYLPAFAFVLAGLCYAQIAFALPALIYFLILVWRRGRRREALISLFGVPVLTVLALLALRYPFSEFGIEPSQAGVLLPPLGPAGDRTAYSLISLPHLIELANVTILVSPVLPAVVILGLGRSRPARWQSIFLLLLAAGPVLFALLANTPLGMVRDWDIFILPVCLGTLWAAAGSAGYVDNIGRPARSIAGMILVTALLHSLFWLTANHSPDLSRERVRRVATNPAFFGETSLAETWRYIGGVEKKAGLNELASESLVQAIKADPNDRMSYRLLAEVTITRAVQARRGVEKGLAEYHALLDAAGARTAYIHQGACFATLGFKRQDLAHEEARKMVLAEPEYPELVATWGDFLRLAGDYEQARAEYERALRRDPNHPRSRLGLACIAGIEGDHATLEAQIRETLRRTPWSPQAQQFARVLRRSGRLTPEQCRHFLYIQ